MERKILRLLHGRNTLVQLHQIHARFLRHGLHNSNLILAHFVSVCGAARKLDYANRVFSQTHNPNILLFNAMIKGYSLSGPCQESLLLFSCMKGRGIWPDEYTFAPLLKSCSGLWDVRPGQCVHGEVIRVGFESFGSIRVGVVELYAAYGWMEDAMKVFDEVRDRDIIIWNLIIHGFCKGGDVDTGLSLFRKMSERSVVSWNSMISCLARSGREDEALELFHEMRSEGFEPDEATLVSVLPVCARLVAVDIGLSIQHYAESTAIYPDSVPVGNALVDFYCKCGDLEGATRVFNGICHKNVVSWNSMIAGLAFNGKSQLGVDLFEEMIDSGMIPNDATFVGVLACCAHAGLIKKGQELFALMTANHGLDPKLEHYGCMVDLLARGGQVRDAYDLLRRMPMVPNAAMWGALLGACRNHGDVEIAEVAVKELITHQEPWNSGNYVLLSNIYAEEGRWAEVEKVRGLMKEKSVKKAIGQSAIG